MYHTLCIIHYTLYTMHTHTTHHAYTRKGSEELSQLVRVIHVDSPSISSKGSVVVRARTICVEICWRHWVVDGSLLCFWQGFFEEGVPSLNQRLQLWVCAECIPCVWKAGWWWHCHWRRYRVAVAAVSSVDGSPDPAVSQPFVMYNNSWSWLL